MPPLEFRTVRTPETAIQSQPNHGLHLDIRDIEQCSDFFRRKNGTLCMGNFTPADRINIGDMLQ
jgi:hypothetical protein